MVCATILRARGLPAYTSISRSCSAVLPATPFSANNCWHALASSWAKRSVRTGEWLPSSGTRSAGFSRLVSSQQL
jgi:hypothetical protein